MLSCCFDKKYLCKVSAVERKHRNNFSALGVNEACDSGRERSARRRFLDYVQKMKAM